MSCSRETWSFGVKFTVLDRSERVLKWTQESVERALAGTQSKSQVVSMKMMGSAMEKLYSSEAIALGREDLAVGDAEVKVCTIWRLMYHGWFDLRNTKMVYENPRLVRDHLRRGPVGKAVESES